MPAARSRHEPCTSHVITRETPLNRIPSFRRARFLWLPWVRYYVALAALASLSSAVAQNSADSEQPTIAVTGVGRIFVAPDQAVVSLGATIQREDARAAQRELDAVMQAATRSIRELGVAAENLQTASVSLLPVYAEPADVVGRDTGAEAARRRDEPRIVAYRATNIVQVTLGDLALVGAVVDAGISAGVNEIRDISFGLADDLPYRVTALERAVEAARTKARAAASALGVRLGQPIEVRERSAAIPYRQLDAAAFARTEAAIAIEPGELAIEATVDNAFALDPRAAASSAGD